jgi:hypothetical protein
LAQQGFEDIRRPEREENKDEELMAIAEQHQKVILLKQFLFVKTSCSG